MATRTQARTAIVQMLYAMDLGNENILQQAQEYLNERKIKSQKAEFAMELLNGVLDHLEQIDEIIKAHLTKDWDFERLDNVDKAILRLGVYEILYTQTPYQVVINEAIEIAKLLSSANSTKFINGMLDKIAKDSK
ncbi:MAG: transcription antitermination factor NusB [Epsilonproteobacteria bacterium]|nr:transcription antitermination factor NusB [Campylobacterota bacterium]